jgi:hypothetical protein
LATSFAFRSRRLERSHEPVEVRVEIVDRGHPDRVRALAQLLDVVELRPRFLPAGEQA